jgi:putative ATPase
MQELGYGKGYKYPHDFPQHFVTEQYLPQALKGRRYYEPSDQGFEKQVTRRLKVWHGETKEASDRLNLGGKRTL